MDRTVVVATHGHCFDGMASAAAFTAFLRALHPDDALTFTYRACDYVAGDSAVPEAWLSGDENAILDFRYTAIPSLTWYFDHHATAFRTEADRAIFDGGLPRASFYEPTYTSCTKLIDDVARDRFGVELGLGELVRWADLIDSAGFADVETAVSRRDPPMWLATVVEHHGDDAFLNAMVPRLVSGGLMDLASSGEVRERYTPLAARRIKAMARMKEHAAVHGSVVLCDLSEKRTDVVEKFGLYALFPGSVYTVIVSRTDSKVKISLGYNPWSNVERRHHLGAICQRHGGGGHPVVGAITWAIEELSRARALAATIAEELAG